MKAQINLEFLASAVLYLLALGTVVAASSAVLPSFNQETEKAELNLEARSTTTQLLTEPGYHTFSGGGTDWHLNNTTRDATTSLGLSNGEDFEINRGKIQALSDTGEEYFNWTQFREISDTQNQYRFNFTWMPIIHTEKSFTRGSPPSNPPITEPTDSTYSKMDNEVHYGSITLEGETYHLLVTARKGVYNGTYTSKNWDFSNIPRTRGESELLHTDASYVIESFQNREGDRGSVVIVSDHLKTYGATLEEDESPVVRLNRFAVLEGEPLRIGVWTW